MAIDAIGLLEVATSCLFAIDDVETVAVVVAIARAVIGGSRCQLFFVLSSAAFTPRARSSDLPMPQ
jgi:hypothetical protein